MAVPLISTSFTTGEVSPSLFGHVDLAKNHSGLSTLRNMWVSYKGGAYSRAGTALVGFSKQTGRSVPPRTIPFQFNINQGLSLEFGNFYMRVISNGAYVIDESLVISNATKANPCVLTFSNTSGAASATANNGAVSSSYTPGEQITLAGGVFLSQTVLAVSSTALISTLLNSPGGGYAPTDTITLAGGASTTPAKVTVNTTRVVSAAVNISGGAGTPGTAIVTGTTGTGTKFQANVTINSVGFMSAVNSITIAGSYTVNPTTPSNEPVTGGGLVGATLNLSIGVLTFTISNGGAFTTNPVGATFTQASTSGSGSGATFKSAVMGVGALTVQSAGVYTTYPSNPVAQASSSLAGLGATFNVTPVATTPPQNGDWVSISGVGGMTQLNGGTFVVASATSTTFALNDAYGNAIDSTSFSAYTSGGVASRIYTLTTPYAEADLEYLKYTQSADVMSITCVNQKTLTEYVPQDLARLSNSNWTMTAFSAAPSVLPPAVVSGTRSAVGGTGVTSYVDYQYVVTAVSPTDGSESVASPIIDIPNSVDIAATYGTMTLAWSAVADVNQYNIYKAKPAITSDNTSLISVPTGSLFGFAGSAYGTQFIDTNIVSDFTQVPPLHLNPFARGKIIAVNQIAGGSNYNTIGYTITTSTGSGAILQLVLVSNALVAVIIVDAGQNYAPTDTITITGDGSGAIAALFVGPQSGTYPGVVAYFQQRRVYASSINNPDTYFMSQPGAYKNFDIRIPTIASDAIIGTPWANQVNGIQFMVPMPGGLVVLTGLAAWQLTGTGGSSLNPQAITPSSQQAQPQAYTGCSPTVPPIKIDYDIVYVQAKGSIYRDLSYQFYTNIYTGSDLTQYSSQLFTGYTIREHAWCEEPYKLQTWSSLHSRALLFFGR